MSHSPPAITLAAKAAVLNYKRLAEVERAFRTLKGVDLHMRPIRHRLESASRPIFFSVASGRGLEAAAICGRSSRGRGAPLRLADGSPAFSFRADF
jgi:hypothetical protein